MHKGERNTDTCYYMDDPGKHSAKLKKPDTKVTYYMSPFIRNVQNRQIYGDRRQISGCQGVWGDEE